MICEALSPVDKIFNLVNFIPLEKCRVHLYTKQGEVLASKLIWGNSHSVGDRDSLYFHMMNLKSKALKKNLSLDHFEIIHNHKSHKISKNSFIVGELSLADTHIAKSLKTLIDLPIKMSIFTRHSFKFSKTF